MMKKLTLALAIALALIPLVGGPAFANSTKLGPPQSPGGRPILDTATLGRVDQTTQRQISDCSLGVNYPSVVSGVSSPISLTNVAALGWTASSYAGNFVVYVTNTDSVVKLVAFMSLTPSAISSTQEAGVVIGPYDYAVFKVSSRDMVNVHLQGLTGTGKGNVSICNE